MQKVWLSIVWLGLAVATTSLAVMVGLRVAAASEQQPPWQAQIAVVWPHDGQGNFTPVERARAVNIAVWPRNEVSCTVSPVHQPSGVSRFSLWVARSNETTQKVVVTPQFIPGEPGSTFPMLAYNNVPTDLVGEPTAQYRFTVGGLPWGGPAFSPNVWVHAADARTFMPQQIAPTGYTDKRSARDLEARLQIVWPHDGQGNAAPVQSATRVNIAVDVLERGTTRSLPPNLQPPPELLVDVGAAKDNNPMGAGVSVPRAQQITHQVGGQWYPRWVFNDIEVDPGQQYHFIALVSTMRDPRDIAFSDQATVWTHAPDARTFLPAPEPPPPCI